MARLPTIDDLGARPIPQSQRRIAQVDTGAISAPGAALGQLGGDVFDVGEMMAEREFTAMAKERDAYVSDQIRSLLYDPENGFTIKRGRAAVDSRADALAKLDALRGEATKGLAPGAARKLEASLANRIEGAKGTVDRHTGSARTDWLNGASDARIEAAMQDTLADPAAMESSIATLAAEYQGRAAREGWSREEYESELGKATSDLIQNRAKQIAQKSARAADEFLEGNKSDMRPSDYQALKAALDPLVKEERGTEFGRKQASSLGDMGSVMSAARDVMGMDENDQNSALKEYLANGGINLDPATTAWCAAFVNATLAKSGMGGTGSLAARSFLNWGEEVSTPRRGDIVVLSRGSNPAHGHVGFFDGFNDDGSIRLLGGNQGNKVKVSSYSSSRILGYRRAPGGSVGGATTEDRLRARQEIIDGISDPKELSAALRVFDQATQNREALGAEIGERVGGDLGRAISENVVAGEVSPAQAIANIAQMPDGPERDAALSEFNVQMSAQEGLANERATAASRAAFEFIEAGGSVGNLDLDVRQALGRQAMSSLREYERSIRSGVKIETDPQAYLELKRMQSDDPSSFERLDMMHYIDKLSRSDWQRFVDQQNPATPKGERGLAPSTLMSTASRAIKSAGLSDDDEANFQYDLVKWQDKFIEDNNASPSYSDVQERVNTLLTQVFINQQGWGGRVSGRMFEIDFDGETSAPTDDMQLEDLLSADRVQVGGKDISARQIELVADVLAAETGETPTALEVVTAIIERGGL